MATPTDNSNITDNDVLQAKSDLAKALKYRDILQTNINNAKAWLKDNPDVTIFPLASDAVSTLVGGANTLTNPLISSIIILKNPVVADMIAAEGSKIPENAPFQITFTTAEKNSYNSFYQIGPTITSVWVMLWRSKYGTYWKPDNPGPTGLGGSEGFNNDLYKALYTSQTPSARRPNAGLMFILNDKQVAWWKKQEIVNTNSYALLAANQKISEYESIIDKGPEINLANSDGTLSQRRFIDLVYNVGSVTEAYLSTRSDFLQELTTFREVNGPTAVTNASQLWVSGATNKGMIQPYTKLAKQNNDLPITEVTLPSASSGTGFKTKKFNPTGFQFLYNPASVDMMYSGMLGVDPNMETTGLDQFNPLGVYTQATINFNILINRMFDFKYYDRQTGVIADKYKNIPKLYYPRQPELSEQRDIFKKGTMYDVEHLLRAVLGFGMPSYLGRNMADGQTADLGFITGIPVELHLGNNLRYLGNVTELRVSHVLFDERMVPIFTNLAISFARLVDPVEASVSYTNNVKVPPVQWKSQNPLLANGQYTYTNHNGR
jgi:hypothetical protein